MSTLSLSTNGQFKIQTADYTGPMDLLVYLVYKRELEATSISLTTLTSEFIAHIDHLPEPDLDSVGDFVFLAAILMEYKLRQLLSQPEQEINPVEVVENIREHSDREIKALRQQVRYLASLEEQQLYLFERGSIRVEGLEEEITSMLLSEVSIYDIALAFKDILNRLPSSPPMMLTQLPYTIESQMEFIVHSLDRYERLSFNQLAERLESRLAVIVTFLAMLELLRTGRIRVCQEVPFGPLLIVKRELSSLSALQSDGKSFSTA